MLRELQLALSCAFRESGPAGAAALDVLAGLRPVGRASPEQGLGVYQSALRNVVERALREILPVCVELVGDACFRQIARRHAARHASPHPDLGCIGDEVPALMSSLDFLSSVPYLADVARLELALHRAADAPDPQVPDDPGRIAEALAAAPDRWRLLLPPSATLIASPHPIRAIWQAHRDDARDGEARWRLPRDAGPDRLIVWRSPDGLRVERVEAGIWPLLVAVEAGACVASLLQLGTSAGAESPTEVLQGDPEDHAPALASLGWLFERGWVAGVAPLAGRAPIAHERRCGASESINRREEQAR